MSVLKNLKRREFLPIIFFPFLMNTVGFLMQSVLVLYALDLGATLLEISMMTLVGGTMGMILRIPFGILSDRYGRKPMLALPEVLICVADLVRATATQPWHLIAASFVGGFAGDFFANLLSIVGDVTTVQERPALVSTLYFFSSLGMVVGPSLASALLLFNQIRTLIWISFFMRMGLVAYVLILVKEPKRTRTRVAKYGASVSNLLKKKTMISAMGTTFFFFIMNSVETTFVPIFGRQNLSLTNSEVASLNMYRSLSLMSFRFFSNEIFSRTGYKKIILLMLSVSSVVGFLYPFSTNYWEISILNLVFGLTFGALSLAGAILTSLVSDETNRGIAQALFSLANGSGMLTPAMMTPIAAQYGLPMVFYVGSLMPLFGIAFVSYFLTEPKADSA